MDIVEFFQNNPWYLWLILPIGLLLIFVWGFKEARQAIRDIDAKGTKSLRQAVKGADEVWGLWFTGDKARGEALDLGK